MAKTSKPTKTSKTRSNIQGLTAKLKDIPLLGEVVTWNARTDSTHKHADVVAALEAAGLDKDMARELLPRFAFSRACRKLAEERIIDVVREGEDEIIFQFTGKRLAGENWEYVKETNLTLNKITGSVSCPNKSLEKMAQTQLDAAMEERTTSDITKIVQRLFEREADLFPIREQGGVYFVPAQFAVFTGKIEHFLVDRLGGRLIRLPIVSGTESGNRAVQESVADALQRLIDEHEDAVAQFTINTRKDTIENAAEKINATRVKIEAYAEYLADKQADLLKSVEAANRKLLVQVEQLSEQRQNAPVGEGGLFGQSVTAVIRWMGKEGWTFAEAKEALERVKVSIAEATIRAQLLAGRQGKRGAPAELSEKQVAELHGKPKAARVRKPKAKKEVVKAAAE